MSFEGVLIILGIVIAGGIGSVLRYLLAGFNGKLPWGILIANVAGSVVIGFGYVIASAYSTFGIPGVVVGSILATGFAGGFTTFSSWAAQTAGLAKQVKLKYAIANLVLTMGLSTVAVLFGMFIASTLIK